MPHFATTALFRKRTAEKRNEKHHEKTSKIHAKSDGKSCRFRKSMADALFHAFCSILAQFLVKNELWDHPGRPWEAQGPSRGRPRGPWGGSRGALGGPWGGSRAALGAFRGRQNGTWTPLGRPGHPQGPSRVDFPWIFDGIGADNGTLGKGKVARMPLPQGACHNATMLVALATGTAELATLPFATEELQR